MPCLNISTNVNLEGVDTSSILSEATSTVAKLIGKPEAYVMIVEGICSHGFRRYRTARCLWRVGLH
ncbi:hypothetical protein KY285_033508 [Solanum tuberosum]|nr:hypothetical protein KY285_033508 [Solanum tuberosum]